MHAHQVDAHTLSTRMSALHEAHLAQTAMLRELEDTSAKVPVLKSTVKKQAQVIRQLESLLAKTVHELKSKKGAEVEMTQMAKELGKLREVPRCLLCCFCNC